MKNFQKILILLWCRSCWTMIWHDIILCLTIFFDLGVVFEVYIQKVIFLSIISAGCNAVTTHGWSTSELGTCVTTCITALLTLEDLQVAGDPCLTLWLWDMDTEHWPEEANWCLWYYMPSQDHGIPLVWLCVKSAIVVKSVDCSVRAIRGLLLA